MIKSQKISRQKSIDKRNSIMSVLIPIISQPEKVQDTALKLAENAVSSELGKENITAEEAADKVALAALSALPEKSLAQPDPTKNIERLISEIANVMDMSVSEPDSKPMDIKQMLVLDYTNNFESTPEDIQESLSTIINTDVRTDKHLQEKKQGKAVEANQKENSTGKKNKDNPLKNAEEAVENNYNMILTMNRQKKKISKRLR